MLDYEAYEEHVVRLADIAAEMRSRWPTLDVVLIHRIGPVVGESSVIVVASAPPAGCLEAAGSVLTLSRRPCRSEA